MGNTRVVFTTNPKEIEFTLNYESNPAVPDDIALFEEVAPANTISNDLFDHTDEAGTTYTHTQLLTGGLNAQVGSAIAIPVGMGDTLHAEVFAKYKDNTGNGNNSGAALAGLLINAFTGGTGMTNELGNQSINNNFGGGSLIGTTGFAPENASAPMAFLNMMFLPEGETIDLEKDVSFAYDQIDGAAEQPNSPTKAAHDRMHIDDFVAPDQGYVLVYLSNESAVMTEVYFDDLKIMVNEHPVVQRSDYYPFGSIAQQYNRITTPKNGYLYNEGTERVDALDLGVDMTPFRVYDPMVGRWWQVDPIEKYHESSYAWVTNNPILWNDPLGLDTLNTTDPNFNPNDIKDDDVIIGPNVLDEIVVTPSSSIDPETLNDKYDWDAQKKLFYAEGEQVLPPRDGVPLLNMFLEPRTWNGYWVDNNGRITGPAPTLGIYDGPSGGGGAKTLVKFKGLIQNRSLRSLTGNELVNAFKSLDFKLSGHAIKRLKDIRTKNLGFNTLNDLKQIFNKGVPFNAGGGAVGKSYKGMEIIWNPKTKNIITIRPAKAR